EGDVRRHRNTPASVRLSCGVEEKEDGRRRDHSANSRRYGQHGLTRIRQFSTHDFPLKFQTYHKKENSHQTVVDPVGKVVFQIGPAIVLEAKTMFKKMKIRFRPGRVGQK